MSDRRTLRLSRPAHSPSPAHPSRPARPAHPSRPSRPARWIVGVVLALAGLLLPAVLEDFWIQLGALVFSSAIAAIGLMLLFGRVGQLSLGHSFFLAVGAYVYVLFASPSGDPDWWGFGLPGFVAIAAAMAAGAIAGLALSPIAARLKGLSLGMATLSLIFIGTWLLYTFDHLTGGYNGRGAPPLDLGPLSSEGSHIAIAGLAMTGNRFLWYVTAILLAAVALFTVMLLKGRVGRAFTAVRDAEVHASALGVEVARYRALAFTISSAFAGLGGALLVIIIQRVVPDYWGLMLSLSYLAMIVIGGMRSVTGAILGALFVTALPAVLQRYGDAIPGVGAVGGSGLGPAVVAQLVYGVAVVVVLIFEPDGLVALFGRLVPRRWRGRAGTRPGPGRGQLAVGGRAAEGPATDATAVDAPAVEALDTGRSDAVASESRR